MNDTSIPSLGDSEILGWLELQGIAADELEELAGDVSRRRYLRIAKGSETAVIAVYPAAMRSVCRRNFRTTQILEAAGIRVPKVLAHACETGLMLLEDVGSQTLYDLSETPAVSLHIDGYFWHSLDLIDRIQTISSQQTGLAELNPPLDRDLLWRELTQTWSSLLEPRGVVADLGFARDLESALQEVCRLLGADTETPCHRDFMSRNLIPLGPAPGLALLDHQDLRLGPCTYDLASLLNDSLFPSAELEEEILSRILGQDPESRVPYHRAAAQRTLKATGTYETFALRGEPRHRKLIPATLGRAIRHLAQLPETVHLATDLGSKLSTLGIC